MSISADKTAVRAERIVPPAATERQRKRRLIKPVIITAAVTVLVIVAAYAGFNIAVDPFGVFGGGVTGYWEYNMTNNPKLAKLAYLDKYHDRYDSYIIGGSKPGAYPVETLNKYTGARFYDLTAENANDDEAQKLAEYVIKNYEVKNIVMVAGIGEPEVSGGVKNELHAKASGGSGLMFYLRHAFLNPKYSIAKLKARDARGYLSGENERYIPETGEYNYELRDIENPADNAVSPEFNKLTDRHMEPGNADKAAAAVKKLCDERGISFKLIVPPMHDTELRSYDAAQLAGYRQRLAAVTDFYDFTGQSDISFDRRYFYDSAHFRRCVGDMMLAYIYGDSDAYVPDGFGRITTAENAAEYAAERFMNAETPREPAEYSKNVPILMYHDIKEELIGDMSITPGQLEEQLKAFSDAGYTAVDFEDLRRYAEQGAELPEKPILITFDDGYRSNYLYAYPLLARYGMKATIFAVGVTTGCDTYKDTGEKINPHFSYAEAKEMTDSGIIDVYSHTYDLHRVEKFDGADYRNGASRVEGESDKDFAELFTADITRSLDEIESGTGIRPGVLSYPQGEHSLITDVCAARLGIYSTVTVNEAPNPIVKGIPQTLYNLNRIGVYADMTTEYIMDRIRISENG